MRSTENRPSREAFTETDWVIENDSRGFGRVLHTVAPWAADWDGTPEARLALYSDVTDTYCYVKVAKITGRRVRCQSTRFQLRIKLEFLGTDSELLDTDGADIYIKGGGHFTKQEAQEFLDSAQAPNAQSR